jgi:hypothetical protein
VCLIWMGWLFSARLFRTLDSHELDSVSVSTCLHVCCRHGALSWPLEHLSPASLESFQTTVPFAWAAPVLAAGKAGFFSVTHPLSKLFFLVVLGFELRVYTLSHSVSPFL